VLPKIEELAKGEDEDLQSKEAEAIRPSVPVETPMVRMDNVVEQFQPMSVPRDQVISEEAVLAKGHDSNTPEHMKESDQPSSEPPLEINEAVYNMVSTSIKKVWSDFDSSSESRVDFEGFLKVMQEVAKDLNVLQGDEDEPTEAALFFQDENLKVVFQQIVKGVQEGEGKKEISHSTVVDILYNVFN
jgi:hypothetical protein